MPETNYPVQSTLLIQDAIYVVLAETVANKLIWHPGKSLRVLTLSLEKLI